MLTVVPKLLSKSEYRLAKKQSDTASVDDIDSLCYHGGYDRHGDGECEPLSDNEITKWCDLYKRKAIIKHGVHKSLQVIMENVVSHLVIASLPFVFFSYIGFRFGVVMGLLYQLFL